MAPPVDVDQLWASLKSAEDVAGRGTALVRSLTGLSLRKEFLSAEWFEERRELRKEIEARLAHGRQPRAQAASFGPDKGKLPVVVEEPQPHDLEKV